MDITQIFAISDNNVIGHDNKLVWRVPNDLKFFKAKTFGHPIIMGRKTFESLGKALPGRLNIVITRNKNFSAPDCIIVTGLADALEAAKKNNTEEIFVIGGAEIFSQSLLYTTKIYITEVKAEVDGNIKYNFDKVNWIEKSREDFTKDDKHAFDYSFVELIKIK